MTLSTEQIEAVKHGEPVRITPPEVGADCVVLRADVYERVRGVIDDGLSMLEVSALVAAQMQNDDERDPLLDTYQRYRR